MAIRPQRGYYRDMDRCHRYLDLASAYLELAPNGIDRTVDLLCRFAALASLYSESRRRYHNLDHISCGYQMYRRFYDNTPAPEFFAWMYHDAVYEPGTPDNEVRSADMFLKDNAVIGFGVAGADRVIELILSTRHIGEKNVVTDIDLSGLGSKPEIYDEQVALIRMEYSKFSDAEWKTGRKVFLNYMLASGRIFVTPEFLCFETPARENMCRELETLIGEEMARRPRKDT
jgi:predicted metal-dependent HD superfamily phosphohydrolase